MIPATSTLALPHLKQEKNSFISSEQNEHHSHSLGLLIFFLAAIFFVGNAVAPVIFDDNEGLYAGAVREMTARHDWLLPTNNGLPRVQKPPFVYWCTLVSTHLLGMSEFSIRLPNALSTAAWIYVIYLIGLRLRGPLYGASGAMILASMAGVYIFTHLVQPEPFLATFISLTIYSFISALAQPNNAKKWFLRAWIFMALGSISKGLHGAAWPFGVLIISSFLFPSQRKITRRFFSWQGFALFLLISVPWYAMLELRLPHVLRDHFVNEQLGAALNTRFPHETRSVPLLTFYLQHLIFFAPWTLLFPAAIYVWWKEKFTAARSSEASSSHSKSHLIADKNFASKEGTRLLAVWVALTFLSLSFSNLQDYYAMTSWGALALFLALPFQKGISIPGISIPKSFFTIPWLLLLLAGFGGLIFSYFYSGILTQAPDVAAPVGDRDTFANAVGGFSPGIWKSFIPMMQGCSWALLIGSAVALYLSLVRKNQFYSLIAICLTMAIPFSCATYAFTVISPYFSLAVPAKEINAHAKPDAIVACESQPNESSSLFYYLNFPVHWVNARFNSNYAGRVLGMGSDLYYNSTTFLPVWNSNKQVFLIIEESRLNDWNYRLAGAHSPHEFLRSGSRVVLVNQ